MIEIRHTGIVTKNLKNSIWFWQKLLKFKIKKQMIERGKTIDKVLSYKNVKVKTLKLEDSFKNKIELLYFFNPPNISNKKIFPYSNGYTHISLTVKRIDNLYKKLKKNKIKFNSKPLISADGKVKMTYCKTPEGGFLELVEILW